MFLRNGMKDSDVIYSARISIFPLVAKAINVEAYIGNDLNFLLSKKQKTGGVAVKRLITIGTVVLCGGIIFAGNNHWNNKISAQSEKVTRNEDVITTKTQELQTTIPKEEPIEEDKKEKPTYTRNLPKELQEKISNATTTGKPLQFVIYGSKATSQEANAWPDLLGKQLAATYGENVFNITVLSEGDKTSIDVMRSNSYEKVSELKPDLILFEPFMIKDSSSKIATKNRIGSIEKMVATWTAENKEVTIFMQPSNPIAGATYYPNQVAKIAEHAKENNIIYLNHWENWPESKDKKIKDYLTDTSEPNGSGHKVWAEYLINYFVAK